MRILFLVLISASYAFGQMRFPNNNGSIKEVTKPTLITAFNFGLEQPNNKDLENWFSKNGVNTSSQYFYNYGLKMLLPSTYQQNRKPFLIGFEGAISWLTNPNEAVYNLTVLVGKNYYWKGFFITPLFGLGDSPIVMRVNNQVPYALMKYNITNGTLYGNVISASPRIMLSRRFSADDRYQYAYGIELGCRIYSSNTGGWTYSGDNYKTRVEGIPSNSTFHPYFSFQVGYYFVSQKTKDNGLLEWHPKNHR